MSEACSWLATRQGVCKMPNEELVTGGMLVRPGKGLVTIGMLVNGQ
jgi:hypothetical protein